MGAGQAAGADRRAARGARHPAADAHARGGVLRLRGRLSRRGRHAAGAAAVLRPRQLAQRDRLAGDPVRPRLPGRRCRCAGRSASATRRRCRSAARPSAMLEALGVQAFPLRAPARRRAGRQGRGRASPTARACSRRSCSRPSWSSREPDRDRPRDPRRRARTRSSSPRSARRRPRCGRPATTARTSTWAARWAPRSRRRSASPRSGRSAT